MQWGMRKTCAECPWLRSSQPGKFPPQRYYDLAHTCKPGTIPGKAFGCHMTSEGVTRACAGMVLALMDDLPNTVRILVHRYGFPYDRIEATGPLYASYRELAAANGCDVDHEAFDGLP